MRRAHKLAYYQGYSEGVAGTCLDVSGVSKKWERAYKQGQADGKQHRHAISVETGPRRLLTMRAYYPRMPEDAGPEAAVIR